MRPWALGLTLGSLLALLGCSPQASSEPGPRLYGYRVVASFPHDPTAFTQGLIYHEGELWEGTGLWGASSLRRVALETGQVLQQRELDARYFGEGIALWQGRLFQLTWRSRVGFVYAMNLTPLGQVHYDTEGWGLTQDGTRLIMSDGTSTLTFRDPADFSTLSTLEVRDGSRPIRYLNELEFIRGEIWANVWLSNCIARIDPATGQVTGWIDLTGLLPPEDRGPQVDVLNGIAYDAEGKRLFLTGKRWPKLFQVELVERETSGACPPAQP